MTKKGITKTCPDCRHIIIRHANVKEGDQEVLCIKCDEWVKVIFILEPKVKIAKVAKALLIALLILLPLTALFWVGIKSYPVATINTE